MEIIPPTRGITGKHLFTTAGLLTRVVAVLEAAASGFAGPRLSAVQPVYCFMCTFDKWLHFYILMGNRNSTSEAQEKSRVPDQTEDERVSNERGRWLQGKKKKNARSSWENSQKVGIWGKLVLEDRRLGSPGLESRQNSCILGGQVKGAGSQEGNFSSGKPAFLNIQREGRDEARHR